ncbi:MAG: hypothetical protein ACQEWM_12155 [Actinomycetota bacterium]
MKQVERGRVVTEVQIKTDGVASLDPLRRIGSLRVLHVEQGLLPDDLVLPHVQVYIGPYGPALEQWSSLAEVYTHSITPGDFAVRLSGPVEVLGVSVAEGQLTIEHLAQPTMVRYFNASFSDHVDVSGLRDCADVERVLFESVAHISGLDVFRGMPELYWIGFSDISEATPLDGLVGVTASGGAGVTHRHPFPPDVRARMRAVEPKWSFPTDERFYVPAGTAPADRSTSAPFEVADDLAFELEDATDLHAALMLTFADAKREPEDGHHADRAIAAAMWLLSSLPDGPTVLDGPDREAPPLDDKLRRAARTALSAVARADAAEGRTHEAESTRDLIARLVERSPEPRARG